jgi:hypothetical protein
LSSVGDIFDDSANVTIPALLRFQSEKGKKGGRNIRGNRAVPTQQNWRKNEAQKDEKKAAGL